MIVNQTQTSRASTCRQNYGYQIKTQRKKLLTSFCPVVARSTLTKDEVVWAEQATEGPRTYRVHCAGL